MNTHLRALQLLESPEEDPEILRNRRARESDNTSKLKRCSRCGKRIRILAYHTKGTVQRKKFNPDFTPHRCP